MNLGLSIRKLRKERVPQLTQAEYAATIGISQTYLSQIESNKKKPSTDILEKIAADFEIPLPIIFWYGIEEKDIHESKREYFRFLKPTIDQMIDSII
jgi:DNA-binding XRE family transcriptional regulator